MEILVPDEYKYLYERNNERPIWKIPDPVLRKVAPPIANIDKKMLEFIERMVLAMKKANGVGLAAPQMGKSLRIIVIAPAGMKPTVLINPEIMESHGAAVGLEGCLSIPGLYGDVERPDRVVVEAYDRKGKPVAYEMEGLPARVVQHEVDHLNGILFTDKADPASLHWVHPDKADTPVE
ncbi:MAG: peptide deformylase [Armatimonadetes bacterium]|nr:peptide deformylase [Armatimonadota bacterium]